MEKSKYAGKTVEIIGEMGTIEKSLFEVEDYWINVSGKSWMFSEGNLACIQYAIRSARERLPIDDNVLYGKIDGLGFLVHESEIVGEV